ncbi:MAG TPA: glycosyltransferase family 2 protein [Thermoanaerobaculia bacterium]|nr:glycosyltransferase family 2 protein [Thermoanaerobaculia bacterium]
MQSRGGVFVVVPAFNEASVVYDVVRELRSEYPNVVVVDDGSRDSTAAEARRGGATVLRHLMNRGQGAALQTGIEYSVQKGAEIVVTFDADGQHRAEDVDRLIEALEKTGADVAVGSRFLELRSNVPALRRLMLRTAAIFMRVTSGVALTDAHNGLRALRRPAAEKIHLAIDGMAHASEIVDQMYRLHLRVIEVPVVIHYSEYSLRKGQSSMAAFRIAFDYLMKRFFR